MKILKNLKMILLKTQDYLINKNKKKFSKVTFLLGTYMVSFFLGTLVFIALFHTSLLSNIHVLFYRGIALLIISCVLLSVVLVFLKRGKFSKRINYKDILLVVMITFSFNMVFFTLVPVTIERSISVFMLKYMDTKPDKKITEKNMATVFGKLFIQNRKAIQKRFDEQIFSGTVKKEGNEYRLTKEGHWLINFFTIAGQIFNLNRAGE